MLKVEQWPLMHRTVDVEVRAEDSGNDPKKRYTFTVSSEEPVARWFGMETLAHGKGNVDLSALRNNAGLFLNHDTFVQVGAIKGATLRDDRKIEVEAQFSRSQLGQDVRLDLEDDIRTQVSIGYQVMKAKRTKVGDPEAGTRDEYLVTRWMPYEVSFVGIAADQTVGPGRAVAGDQKFPVEIEDGDAVAEGEGDMTKEELEAQARAASGGGGGSVAVLDEAKIHEAAATRASEIAMLAQKYGRSDKAAEWIRSGKPVAEIAQTILAEIGTPASAPAAGSRELIVDGVSARDRKAYSFRKAILQALDMKDGRMPVGLEYDLHRELEKQMPGGKAPNGGFLLATSLKTPEEREADAHREMHKRAWPLDSATATEGAEFKFTQAGDFIDQLRTAMYVAAMGARIMNGLQGPLSFPRQTAGSSASWKAEEAAGPANVMPTFDSVAMAPKTLILNTGFTRQLLVQSSFDVEAIVRQDIAEVYGRAIDQAALHGTGAPEPTGIYAASGVNAEAFAGTVTYAHVLAMVNAVQVANAGMGALGWLGTPGVATKAMQLLEIAGVAPKIWSGGYDSGIMAGYRALATNQLKSNMGAGTNEHGLIFGNWNDLMVGNWNALEILVDPITSKLKGIIELTAFAMVDIAIRHGASFSKATGLIP